jgi:hypothetical protein
MSKGITGLLVMFVAIIFVFVILFVFGVAGNYGHRKVTGFSFFGIQVSDPLGLGAFFYALSDTVTEFTTMANLLIWTLMFFIVQGIFLYAYYMVAKVIWVHIPQFQKWFAQAKVWLS